jgi:iron complex transport system permease protein
VTTGAACAAAISIVLAGSLPWSLSPALRGWLLPVAAFSGALITCLLLDAVARWLTPGSVTGLLLTGIAMNALAAAVIGICTYLSTDEQLRNLSFWTLGSLRCHQLACADRFKHYSVAVTAAPETHSASTECDVAGRTNGGA